jgi:hypothetical protein
MFGWACRRSQQYQGTTDSSDILVEQTPTIFWEIKRVEKLQLWPAMALAVSQAVEKIPVIMHRRNRDPYWLITVRLDDLARLADAIEQSKKLSPVVAKALSDSHSGDSPRGS